MKRRLWFLRNGNHLCCGLAGVASTEYGDKTWWLRLPFGVLVFAVRHWTWAETVADYGDDAERAWAEWATARQEGGADS